MLFFGWFSLNSMIKVVLATLLSIHFSMNDVSQDLFI